MEIAATTQVPRNIEKIHQNYYKKVDELQSEESYTFGDLLKGYQKRAGLSQKELADRLEISRETLSNWETGKYLPKRYADKIPLLRDELSLSEEEYLRLEKTAFLKPQETLPYQNPVMIADRFPLPLHHVPRSKTLCNLCDLVLAAQQSEQWVALIGLVGQGKTTLLAEFVRSEEVLDVFGTHVAGITVNRTIETQGQDTLSIGLMVSLLKQLPGWQELDENTIANLRASLRKYAENHAPVLLVVDNISQVRILELFHDIPGITVLVSMRRESSAGSLGILPRWQMNLGALTQLEAEQLAGKVWGHGNLSQDERKAASNAVKLLDRHPWSIRVLAVVARRKGWMSTYQYLQGTPEEQQVVLRSFSGNAHRAFDLLWAELTQELRSSFAMLGGVPFFEDFDQESGRALWGGSAVVAEDIWQSLMDWQLVMPLSEGRYRLHAQARKLAEEQFRQLPLRLKLTTRLWFLRYRHGVSLPWFHCLVSKPPSISRFYWLSSHLPGTEGHRLQSIASYLLTTIWQPGAGSYRLNATPKAYVLLWYIKFYFYVGGIFAIVFRFSVWWFTKRLGLPSIVEFLSLLGFYPMILRFLDFLHIVHWEYRGRSFLDSLL